MLSESDLYNSNTEPNNNVNPKSLGAMWINYSNGRHYICSNNTMNNNTWLDPIGILTNEFNRKIEDLNSSTNNSINAINSNINNLTNDTNTRINSNKSDIIVTNRRIDELNVSNNNRINSIDRKINEINTRIDDINPASGLGYNQKWYKVARQVNIWYQNTTPSPITIIATFILTPDLSNGGYKVTLDVAQPNIRNNGVGTSVSVAGYSEHSLRPHPESGIYANMFCIVPPTFYYRLYSNNIRAIDVQYWSELR